MLLLRQLDHLTTEESIFEAVSTLEGVYRTILIRDKLTKMSCEFAFVEFVNVQVYTSVFYRFIFMKTHFDLNFFFLVCCYSFRICKRIINN